MRTVTCTVYGKLSKTKNLRRISSSSLRFALLVYVYVHSRRQIRAFLELLAACFVFKQRICYEIQRCVSVRLGYVQASE